MKLSKIKLLDLISNAPRSNKKKYIKSGGNSGTSNDILKIHYDRDSGICDCSCDDILKASIVVFCYHEGINQLVLSYEHDANDKYLVLYTCGGREDGYLTSNPIELAYDDIDQPLYFA